MLKLYITSGGTSLISPIVPCLLMLEEIKKDYEVIQINIKNLENKSDEFLKISPFGNLPCLDDEGNIFWNEIAINTYLAEKYQPELIGTNIEEKAIIKQWLLWTLSEFQENAILYLESKNRRLMESMHLCKNRLMKQTIVIDNQLKHNSFLAGNKLSIADIQLIAFANIHKELGTDLHFYPNFRRWFKSLMNGLHVRKLYSKDLIN